MGCSVSVEASECKSPKQRRATKNDIQVCDSKKWMLEKEEQDKIQKKHKTEKNPWSKVEDPSMAGMFFYVNSVTGEQTRDEPPDFHVTYHKGHGLRALQKEHDAEVEANSPELKPEPEPEKKKRKGHLASKGTRGMGEMTEFEKQAASIQGR